MGKELLGLTLRVSIMYLFALSLLRLAGKRSIGNLSPLDFIVTLIIGDMFDDIFWTEIPLSQAVVGMATIIVLHMGVEYASYLNKRIEHWVCGGETPIVRSGRLVQEGMRNQRFPREEVYADLRLQGEDTLRDIRAANLEPNGQLSVLHKEDAQPAQKKDLPQLLELFR
jgi:uncharacterized membrane protein YcaP (DUF421 family)